MSCRRPRTPWVPVAALVGLTLSGCLSAELVYNAVDPITASVWGEITSITPEPWGFTHSPPMTNWSRASTSGLLVLLARARAVVGPLRPKGRAPTLART